MEKIKNWYKENHETIETGVKRIAKKVGLAAICYLAFEFGAASVRVNNNDVYIRNPEIKTLTDKANEEIKEILG